MQYKAVFFDLDGTLLPLDQDEFVKVYFAELSAYMAQYGYEPKSYCDSIMKATYTMMKNDGGRTNEEAFWDLYLSIFGEDARKDEPVLEDFYRTNFENVKRVTGYDPAAAETVKLLLEKDVPLVLATNPVFPPVATEARIRWAGIDPSVFRIITTYNNIGYCKPSIEYYKDLCDRMGYSPEECVMIGNDTRDDMVAETIGMKVFLLTDNLVNRENKDITTYNRGSFAELKEFLGV